MANAEIINRKDLLTGFHTKEGLAEYLASKLTAVYDKPPNLAVIILDLDNFKGINDKYGHLVGDDALRYFSMIINVALKGRYFVARYGGDEFVIVMEDSRDGKESLEVTKRIKAALKKEKFHTSRGILTLSTSMGIAGYPHDANTVRNLLEAADQALYFSKKHGRSKAVSSRHLKSYSLQGQLMVVGQLAVVTVAIVLLTLSYQRAESFKGLMLSVENLSIFLQYFVHRTLYVNDYVQLETTTGKTLEGWVIREGVDGLLLSIKNPAADFNLFFGEQGFPPPLITIPANSIKSAVKSRR